MKLQSVLPLLGLASVAYSKPAAQVLLSGSSKPSNTIPSASVSPHTARFIFAQRLDLSDDYSLANASPEEVEHINNYGGPKPNPLTWAKTEGSRLMLVIEGVQKPERFSDSRTASFSLENTPHPKDTEELLLEFKNHASDAQDPSRGSYVPDGTLAKLAQHAGNEIKVLDNRVFAHFKSIERLSNEYGKDSKEVDHEVSSIINMIDELSQGDDFATVTVAVMPEERQSSKAVGLLKAYGAHVRRNVQIKKSEFPLSDTRLSGAMAAKDEVESSSPAAPVRLVASDGGPIPSRFSSQKECERVTANCTGHGECKSFGRTTSDDHAYFGCVCNKPYIRKNGDGSTKTINFGGAACQKKDVVAPFWLLAGTTIFLLTIVSMGIGLLYSMGSDELPSVIGAGVTGPRAK